MRLSFYGLLFCLFLGLKLTGYIAWSWIWVTAPLWVPYALAMIIYAVIGICVGIAFTHGKVNGKKAT